MANKIITAAIALMMGFTFSAFAGDNNKENKETKTSNEVKVEAKTGTPTETTTTSTVYYWYDLAGNELMIDGNPSEEPEGTNCLIPAESGCAKGFTSPPLNPVTQPANVHRRQ